MAMSLNPDSERLLEAKLRDGPYASVDDVVRAAVEALSVLDGSTLPSRALDAIDRAEEQIDRGEVHDLADVRERIRNRFLGI